MGDIDLQRPFRLLRSDPEWLVKVVVALALLLVPILGVTLVFGWLAFALRRSVARVEPAFPPWSTNPTTWLDYLVVGVKGLLVALVWSFPSLMLSVTAVGCVYFGTVGSIVAAVASGDPSAIQAALATSLCMMVVVFSTVSVLTALLGLPAAVAIARYELSGDLQIAFDFGAVRDVLAADARSWVVTFLVVGVVGSLVAILSGFLPIVGPLLVTFGLFLVRAFAAVSLLERYVAAGGKAPPLGALEPRRV